MRLTQSYFYLAIEKYIIRTKTLFFCKTQNLQFTLGSIENNTVLQILNIQWHTFIFYNVINKFFDGQDWGT